MQDALEKAFTEASRLPEDEQRWLADFILDEIASERRWADLIARSGSVLDRLIAEARAEDDAGETLPLDPDTL
jgi:hypothetical protein